MRKYNHVCIYFLGFAIDFCVCANITLLASVDFRLIHGQVQMIFYHYSSKMFVARLILLNSNYL